MAGILQSSVGLLRSRLSRRIVFWVFLSILVIEGIIFVPSYYNRRGEKLRQLEALSSELLSAVKNNVMAGMASQELLQQIKGIVPQNSVILGAALYAPDCRLVSEFGEAPEMACPIANRDDITRGYSPQVGRYDVAWPKSQFQDRYILIVRHDASQVQGEMTHYALTIAGLVVIISAFVTLTTVLMLERLLINPLMHLRDDLMAVGDAVSRNQMPDFYSRSLNRNDELGDVANAFNEMFMRVQREIGERKQAEAALKIEQEKADRLLKNVLPASIAEQLKQDSGAIASRFEEATILFADIVDFTGLSANVSPTELVCFLNEIFSTFDFIADRLGLEKIKTIGDAYMVVGGLPIPSSNHTEQVMMMAVEMISAMKQFRLGSSDPFHLRIGINTGPVVAGVIGLKKFSYDLWGDAVNIASRMESHGVPDRIHVSEATYLKLKHLYRFESRGAIKVKGRGLMQTYLYCES